MTESHAEGRLASGQYWQSWSNQTPAGLVIIVHGVHEHSGRYQWVAERLVAAGYDVHAVDHPGHGRSPGRRGNITSMAAAVDGVDAVTRMAAERVPDVPVFVYGHSLGGLIALQYLTGKPIDRVRGGIISAPALDTSAATGLQRRLAPPRPSPSPPTVV